MNGEKFISLNHTVHVLVVKVPLTISSVLATGKLHDEKRNVPKSLIPWHSNLKENLDEFHLRNHTIPCMSTATNNANKESIII